MALLGLGWPWSRGPRARVRQRGQGGMRPRGRLGPRVDDLEGRLLLSGLPGSWAPRGIGGGSVLVAPQISPFDPREMYVSSELGALLYSSDAGGSWRPVDFRQVQSDIQQGQVQFTEDPSIRYVIDETSGTWNGYYGNAPAKSTDGGVTWQHLANDPTHASAFRLLADPSDHNRLLLSNFNELFMSRDGGATWASVFATSDSNNGLHIAGAFFDGPNIDVGTGKGLLVSTDGGASFRVSNAGGLPAGQGILALSGAKQGGVTRLFAVTRSAGEIYAGVLGSDTRGDEAVYTLDVGQGGWKPSMNGIAPNTYPTFAGAAVGNVNVAYVAGITNGLPSVYKTSDGGASWASVLLPQNNQNVSTGWVGSGGDLSWYWSGEAMGLAVDSADPSHLAVTDFGFAYASDDGGANWRQLYEAPADQNPAGAPTPRGKAYHTDGLNNSVAWDLNWADPKHLIVGMTDIRGAVSADGGQTFSSNFSGLYLNTMYQSVTQAGTGVVYAATSSVHDMYESNRLDDTFIDTGTGSIVFSTDKGTIWQPLHDFGHPVVWVATDPSHPNRLYASVVNSTQGGVYVTNDLQDGAASVWTRLAAPPRTQGHPLDIRVLNDGTLVATYSGRLAGSPPALTDSSGVFVSTDGGRSWADRSDARMRYWTKDLVVDPNDPSQSTWYVGSYDGWGAARGNGGLYRTTDRGLTWTRFLGGNNVNSVTFSPTDPGVAFVTTEGQGLWTSSDIRSAQPTFTQDPNFPFAKPERVFFNPYDPSEVWVTTLGNGLYVGSVPNTPTVPLQYDFGTGASPVAAGYTQVTGATAYDPARGYGWVSGSVAGYDTGSGTALGRDLNFVNNGTARFAVALADGTYDVTLTVGNGTAAALEGAPAVSLGGGAWLPNTSTTRVTVVGGLLTVDLAGVGGSQATVMGLVIAPAT